MDKGKPYVWYWVTNCNLVTALVAWYWGVGLVKQTLDRLLFSSPSSHPEKDTQVFEEVAA